MNEEWLKPCPFCGFIEPWVERIRWFWKVTYNVCCHCGATQFEEYKTKQEAIAAWNERVND